MTQPETGQTPAEQTPTEQIPAGPPPARQPAAGRPVALVTGGSRGIGRAICQELASTHRVLVGATSRGSAAAVAAALPDAGVFVADLTDSDAVADAAAAIDRLDVLVHSAGIARMGTVADATRTTWLDTFHLNVAAVADLTRLLLPRLRETHGLVIAINSGAGFNSGPGAGPYSASKFGLRALTDALRAEERGRVRVTSIHPGRVATDMQAALFDGSAKDYRPKDHMPPEAIAQAVRLAVDIAPPAVLDEVSVRPAVSINP